MDFLKEPDESQFSTPRSHIYIENQGLSSKVLHPHRRGVEPPAGPIFQPTIARRIFSSLKHDPTRHVCGVGRISRIEATLYSTQQW